MSSLASRGSIAFTASADQRMLGPWRVSLQRELPRGAATTRQVHGGSIVPARLAAPELPADGIFLEGPGTAAVRTADCVPVVLTSDSAALVLHVSRKTLIHGLLDNAFSYIPAKSVDHVYAGPFICEYHFSFEREEADLKRFREVYPRAVHFHNGKLHVSLRSALERVLQERDIHPQRIVFDGRCTYEQLSLPSYRRWLDNGKIGELEHQWTVVERPEHSVS